MNRSWVDEGMKQPLLKRFRGIKEGELGENARSEAQKRGHKRCRYQTRSSTVATSKVPGQCPKH